jgi:hypothetical protein
MNLIILPNQLFPLKLIENMKDINTIYLIFHYNIFNLDLAKSLSKVNNYRLD